MTKLFLELEFQHKVNKQNEKGRFLSRLSRFSRQDWIQKIKLFKCYTEKDKNKNWTDLSLLGQESTFKVSLHGDTCCMPYVLGKYFYASTLCLDNKIGCMQHFCHATYFRGVYRQQMLHDMQHVSSSKRTLGKLQ